MNEPQAPVVASDVLLGTPIGDYLERGGTFLFWTCPNKCGGSVDWRMEVKFMSPSAESAARRAYELISPTPGADRMANEKGEKE